MRLQDYDDNAGSAGGHYFHQYLLVAKMIFESNPKRNIDIGSRFDGFIAHVASYREIEVLDIRSLNKSIHKNIKFVRADLIIANDIGKTDSLSCLHALEHFGLGRYTDPVDIHGHIKGIKNMVSILESKGTLYLSFPIGSKDEIYFNAHRIFHPKSIFKNPSIRRYMDLVRFDYLNDDGDLILNANLEDDYSHLVYGCGIYTFKKR
tara:strand:- start:3841 stop:4458 length:618 start_codon:yes stop_codon:yes gene_type:complete